MNHLLNISEGTSLAFHSLAMMAQKAPRRLNVKTLASDLGASEAHLAKVMQKLNKAGIISSVRGPAGGFVLNRPAEEVNFLTVYEVLEAPVELGDCPLGKQNCSLSRCIFEGKMRRISTEMYHALEEIRLSDFTKKDDAR